MAKSTLTKRGDFSWKLKAVVIANSLFIKRICYDLNRNLLAILCHCSCFHVTPPVGIFNRRVFNKTKLALVVSLLLSPSLCAAVTIDNPHYDPEKTKVDDINGIYTNTAYTASSNIEDGINIDIKQTKSDGYHENHSNTLGIVGYLQSGADITVNGPLSVENLQVDVETDKFNTLSITSGINIDKGSLTLTDEAHSAISVKNVIHNYSYKEKISNDKISRSDVFGINLNNVAIKGVSSLSAENIQSNTVYNAYRQENKINHGSIIGLNLSHLEADRKINLSASNIKSTLAHDDVTKGFSIPTYGIVLTGKKQ